MQPFELLDRFELLEQDNENLSLLRRSYIDKDLSSIFKLLSLTNDEAVTEEIRKAVLEKNLYSLFRLITVPLEKEEWYEDFRRSVTEQNMYCVFRLVQFHADSSEWIDDFRRAVTEHNLYSLFRCMASELNVDNLEDFKSAVTEENLHSIFRLVENEHLRKFVLEDNQWSMWKLLAEYTPTQFVAAFKNFFVNNIDINDDCLSRGQVQSKLWLVRELKKLDLDLGMVFLCAGWYATLSTMMFEAGLKIFKLRSFDIDPTCVAIADRFNKPWEIDQWRFKAVTADILNLNYSETTYEVYKPDGSSSSFTDIPDTIINTSCEHIPNFDQWYAKIPEGKLLILQTNNYFEIEDHINCSANLEEFRAQCPMQEVMFAGKLALDKYTRYMLIGRK